MAKDTFLIKTKYKEIVTKLSDKQAGILFKMLFEYVANGVNAGSTDDKVDMAFDFIKIDLDAFAESYQKKIEANRENGKKGGAPKGNSNALRKNNPNNPTVEKQPKQPKTTQNKRNNPNDNDKDNDIKEKDIPKGISKKKAEADASPDTLFVSESFKQLTEWIEHNAPLSNKLLYPLTEEQVDKLYNDYPEQIIKKTLLAMHNWKDLRKKNNSTYLTLRKWIDKDFKNAKNEKNKRNIITTENAKFQTSKDLED